MLLPPVENMRKSPHNSGSFLLSSCNKWLNCNLNQQMCLYIYINYLISLNALRKIAVFFFHNVEIMIKFQGNLEWGKSKTYFKVLLLFVAWWTLNEENILFLKFVKSWPVQCAMQFVVLLHNILVIHLYKTLVALCHVICGTTVNTFVNSIKHYVLEQRFSTFSVVDLQYDSCCFAPLTAC